VQRPLAGTAPLPAREAHPREIGPQAERLGVVRARLVSLALLREREGEGVVGLGVDRLEAERVAVLDHRRVGAAELVQRDAQVVVRLGAARVSPPCS